MDRHQVSPGGDRPAVPGVYHGGADRPGPVELVLEVDAEVFAVRRASDGGWAYDWLSGPNHGYGFGSRGPPVRSAQEHRAHIRTFLSMIDPSTGYLADD